MVLKSQQNCLRRHLKTKKHLDFSNQDNKAIQEDKDEYEKENENKPEINTSVPEAESDAEESAEEDTEERNDKANSSANASSLTEGKNNNYGKSKAHLDAIRQKAIMKIREKKQHRINKENEIKKKAEQYDLLVKSLEEEKKQKAEKEKQEKIKEMEYKSSQYDKMVKQQQRNTAITSLSNEKIIDDIKEQRINYLMRYLQNPSHY